MCDKNVRINTINNTTRKINDRIQHQNRIQPQNLNVSITHLNINVSNLSINENKFTIKIMNNELEKLGKQKLKPLIAENTQL